METILDRSLDALVILLLVYGIYLFREPRRAQTGNLFAALAIAAGGLLTLWRTPPLYVGALAVAVVIGGAVGWILAARTGMLGIPALIAIQHGAGGLAACLVAAVELYGGVEGISLVHRSAGIAGLIIGAGTFSSSLIACGKLSGRLRPQPVLLKPHNALLLMNASFIFLLMIIMDFVIYPGGVVWLVLASVLSIALGILFSIRIGGADMPVLISFLNATAGLAAALCGIILQNRLLIAFGATVTASGSILTYVMCRAMNRGLVKVFTGSLAATESSFLPNFDQAADGTNAVHSKQRETADKDPLQQAVQAARNAETVIIIPGYGMAIARAQFQVARLAEKLQSMGKDVKFAIHPVAGRMPGHMHVLLAEADIDYTKLYEMDAINAEFRKTDLALIVGACDVVNPAANASQNTPISGMPILLAGHARDVVVCNLDHKPGYSGVENLLYSKSNTIMVLGDAQQTLTEIQERL
jgi:H+-translocating NAD(P) transhydrogenase subunit beta